MNKKLICLQVTIELYERLRKSAYENHMSISKFIRHIIDQYYEGLHL